MRNYIVLVLLGFLASIGIACSGPKVAKPSVPVVPPAPTQVAAPSPSPAPAPAPETPEVNKSEVKADISALIQAITKLERQGTAWKVLRDSGNAEKMRLCTAMADHYSKQVEELSAKASSLPDPFSFYLGVATTDLKLCLTCSSPIAVSSCESVRRQVAEAKKALENW